MGFTGQASRRTIGTGNIAIEAHRKLCSKVSCSSFTRHSASRSVGISAIIVEAERRLDFSVYENQTDYRCDSSFEHIDSNPEEEDTTTLVPAGSDTKITKISFSQNKDILAEKALFEFSQRMMIPAERKCVYRWAMFPSTSCEFFSCQ